MQLIPCHTFFLFPEASHHTITYVLDIIAKYNDPIYPQNVVRDAPALKNLVLKKQGETTLYDQGAP